MPLRDFQCQSCHLVQERFYGPAVTPQCRDCGGDLDMMPLSSTLPKTSVFPFITPHIDPDGKPMIINDIGHLRRVEKQYGVVLTAFSHNPNNPDAIRDLPRYRGEDIKQGRR
jgi:hypothetical protein